MGTIAAAVASNISRKGWKACFSTMRTVCGSRASQVSISWKMARARGASSMWNFMIEKTTSSAVKGCPSCHFTPCCRLNTYSLPSGLMVQDRASSGVGSSVLEKLSSPWNIFGAATSVGPCWFTPICSTGGSGVSIICSVPPRRGATPCASASEARISTGAEAAAAMRPRRETTIFGTPQGVRHERYPPIARVDKPRCAA